MSMFLRVSFRGKNPKNKNQKNKKHPQLLFHSFCLHFCILMGRVFSGAVNYMLIIMAYSW